MDTLQEFNELVLFADFVLDGRVGRSTDASRDNILRLMYLLSHAQSLSIAEASRALRVSKPLFSQTILPENPLFNSEMRPGNGRRGGREKDIILSKKSREYQQALTTLAERRLGSVECQRLRIEAGKSRREALRIEKRKQQDEASSNLKKALTILRRPAGLGYLGHYAEQLGMSEEQLLVMVKNGR